MVKSALTAAVHINEGFNREYPLIFYTGHSLLTAAALGAMLYNKFSLGVPTRTVLVELFSLICLWGMALTGRYVLAHPRGEVTLLALRSGVAE